MTAIDTVSDQDLDEQPTAGGTRLSCRLELLRCPGRPVTVLSLFGEIDICTRSTAETAVAAALDHAPGPVVVDLSGLTFCSARGVGVFAAWNSTVDGHDYVLAGIPPHLQRITTLLWTARHPDCYPHTAAAVTAVCVTPAASRGD